MVEIHRDHADRHSVLGTEMVPRLIDVGTALHGAFATRRVGPNQDIILEGEAADGLFILQEGWAYRYRLLDDGRRHITNFLIDGDVIGPYTVTASHFVATLTAATLGRTSRDRVRALLAESPDFVAAMTNAMTVEFEILSERALNLARCNAKERMAQLLAELAERTEKAGLSDGRSFAFPASQEVIADCLGLSVVHVNRTLRSLREERVALVGFGQVSILDPARLTQLASAG